MALIYETANFILESHDNPEVDRLDGGHVKISPKIPVEDRTKLTPNQAVELMRFTIISAEAMVAAMEEIGVEIGRVNYQDNGNWKPSLHIHLYCRAKSAKYQKYGDPIIPGHKSEYQPLNKEDANRIALQIDEILKLPKYADSEWRLV